MTEKHDVTKSSNPDVQALLVVITGLVGRIEALQAQVFALAGEIASIPDQLVVPGPEGEVPQVVNRRVPAPIPSVLTGTPDEEGYCENPVYAEAALYSSEAKPAAPIPESSISEDEKLAELVGDARGAMADYKEVLVDLDTAPGSALVKR